MQEVGSSILPGSTTQRGMTTGWSPDPLQFRPKKSTDLGAQSGGAMRYSPAMNFVGRG